VSDFSLRGGQPSIPRVLGLAGRPLDPDDDADVDVGEGEDRQRQEVLQRHHGHRVGVALAQSARPDLVAEVAAVDGRQAGVDGDREGRGGGEQPRGADDGRRLRAGQSRPQRKDDSPVPIDADRQHRERAQEHRHRLARTTQRNTAVVTLSTFRSSPF